MHLGHRTARAHDTARVRRHALRSEDFADFSVNDRVRTRDGIGKVIAVEDGPFPQTEQYRVTLEGGMGGGLYSTREILGKVDNVTSSVERTAADDYPELGSILQDRPNIAREGRRDPFVHEARKPADLGPDWTHVPANPEFGEQEHYVHHDVEKEATKVLFQSKGGMRPEWSMAGKSWCGFQHEPHVLRRDSSGSPKPVRSAEEAVTSPSRGTDYNIDMHSKCYHNTDNSCRYEHNESEEHNRLHNHDLANLFRARAGMDAVPGSQLHKTDRYRTQEPHPQSPRFEKFHEELPRIREVDERHDQRKSSPQGQQYHQYQHSAPMITMPGVAF